MEPRKNSGVTFFFLRHGESEANLKKILAGQSAGVHLTKNGRAEIDAIRENYQEYKFDLAYSSPLERAQESAEIFLSQRNLDAKVEPAFVEMNYGTFSNQKLATLARKKEWSEITKNPVDYTFPKGESFVECNFRLQRIMSALKTKSGKNLLVVTHGDIIKMILAQSLGLPLNSFQNFRIDTGSMTEIYYDGEKFHLLRSNYKVKASIVSKESTLGGEIK